ncbi:MAG: class I SAM-dependent methyltransferase [Abditibacteriota bacterium]|nr:class I SAM-dependent methyltransferase [Abditibacteriota bacterium]
MDSNQFNEISQYYDELMHGVPYKYWVAYIENIFRVLDIEPVEILDVACGTGMVSNLLSERNYKLTGFDLSESMIKVAKGKYPHIDFYCQNAKDFELNKTFDVAISLFDSLNYIINKSDLQSAFRQVYKHLKSPGYFIFDMNTEYALANDFFAQVNLSPDAYPQYIWEPDWNDRDKICTVNMTFIVKDEKGKKREFKEVHIQRAYGIEEITYMLKACGFNVLNVYSAYRFNKPTKRSDRVYFVAKREE